jgi:phage baseplate assembly protein W
MKDSTLRTDIKIRTTHAEARMVFRPATRERQTDNGRLTDFAAITGRENLGQAIMMRLLTPMGEIAALGHPTYGSRLHELIGGRNTETTRNLAKLYILESLHQEPRIKKIVSVKVTPHEVYREAVVVSIAVVPVDEVETMYLEPFTLEFAP